MGASGKPDRATHEPSQQAVSAVPVGIPSARDLVRLIAPIVNAGDDACLKGTPMIPLHRDTVRAILASLEGSLPTTGTPSHICGHPLPGWRLDKVEWSEIQGQPDGWIVSLKREQPSWSRNSYIAMARSDLGPLEAWDESLRIAQRSDAAAQAIEARRAETQSGSVHESAVGEADAPQGHQP